MRELADLHIEPGTKVLVRADLNVPLVKRSKDSAAHGPRAHGPRAHSDPPEITDDLRVRASVPTICALRDRGASVIVCSHLGRPKGHVSSELSLAPVAKRLGDLLGAHVTLLPAEGDTIVGPKAKQSTAHMQPGEVVLLENLRFESGEERNDPIFVAELASLADIYVNDAFGSSHRAHASVDGVCRALPHAMGLLVAKEVQAFDRLLCDPPRPFLGILGGAKVSDKLGVIDSLLDKVDGILIGGAMAFTFVKAQGGSVGNSLTEDDRIPDVEAALAKATKLGHQIVLPTDVVCAQQIASDAATIITAPGNIPDGQMGLDIGPATIDRFRQAIAKAAAVLWNGPMGVFETPPFDAGTRSIAEACADAAGFTVVGGGDSASALRHMGLAKRIDHLSTGGGASLELIENGDLPGLAALRSPDPT